MISSYSVHSNFQLPSSTCGILGLVTVVTAAHYDVVETFVIICHPQYFRTFCDGWFTSSLTPSLHSIQLGLGRRLWRELILIYTLFCILYCYFDFVVQWNYGQLFCQVIFIEKCKLHFIPECRNPSQLT